MSSDSPASPSSQSSSRRGSLLVIFLTVFVDLLGFAIVLPLLPVYGRTFEEQYNWTPMTEGVVLGSLMASFSIMQFFFLPVWGKLSDRFGRRPILMIGLAGSTVFYFAFGIAVLAKSLVGLFVARIGAGVAGATISTAQAYIADTTTKESRTKGMALIGAAFALGFTIGPAIGAAAVLFSGDPKTSPWPGFVAAAFSATALVLAIFRLPESLTAESEQAQRRLIDLASLRRAAALPSIGLLLATTFIAVFSFAKFETTLSLQIEKITLGLESNAQPPAILGALVKLTHTFGYDKPDDVKLIAVFSVFIMLGLILTIAQGFLVRRLATRMAEGTMAQLGCVIGITAFVILAMAARNEAFHWLLVGMVTEVIGFSFVNPALQSLLSRRTPPDQQGGVLGLGQSASSLARIFGPLIGIPLWKMSAAAPYWAAAVWMAGALAMVTIAVARGKDY